MAEKGKQMADHKYIDRKMGKNGKWEYIYPGDTDKSISTRNSYSEQKERLKALKAKQKELEGQIDDDALSSKEKSDRAVEAAAKMDKVLARIDKLREQMKTMRKDYRKETGRKISEDIDPEKKKDLPTTKKEIDARLTELRRKAREFEAKMNDASARSKSTYAQGDEYNKNNNNRAADVTWSIGTKYESQGRRYADKVNSINRQIRELEKLQKESGQSYVDKILSGNSSNNNNANARGASTSTSTSASRSSTSSSSSSSSSSRKSETTSTTRKSQASSNSTAKTITVKSTNPKSVASRVTSMNKAMLSTIAKPNTTTQRVASRDAKEEKQRINRLFSHIRK